MTLWSENLDNSYLAFAVDATLTVGTAVMPIRAIDKTQGLEVSEQNNLQTIRPAACLRMSQLLELGIQHPDLVGGSLELNDKVWRIHSHLLRPTPDGELKGEVIVFLLDETA